MTEIRRMAMISLHTSPLDQPGTGDAGGMNVYVVEVARRLAARGIEVDIFTRATSSGLDPVVPLAGEPASRGGTDAAGRSGDNCLTRAHAEESDSPGMRGHRGWLCATDESDLPRRRA